MNDEAVQVRIEELEADERRLRSDESQAASVERRDRLAADAKRLEAVCLELDRLLD
jgi:hypothetical protein